MNKKLFWKILDPERKTVFSRLNKVLGHDYYLAGGTALALQIGHRESLDFDLFRDKDITFAVKRKLLGGLRQYHLTTLVDTADELTIVLDGNIKITLLNYYWRPLFPLVKTTGNLPLLSIKDIAATKAYALGRRGNYRDYFDLYVMVKNNFLALDQITDIAKKKYGEVFSERMFLEQLAFTGDIVVDEKLRYLSEQPAAPKTIAAFFRNKIKEAG
ncbi:MAG: nucleotidyl transferase AbiEii/AbiGii toxin family protein [bacterium]